MIRCFLLIGRSGSGKSPLGDALEKSGRSGIRFHHCDFGARLRAICAGNLDIGLNCQEIAYVQSLMNGRLFDAAHLDIAYRVVRSFIPAQRPDPARDFVLLNGFPRTLEQARYLGSTELRVVRVLYLETGRAAARYRKIAGEKGYGVEDRTGRTDRGERIFLKRERAFEQETLPLLNHYEGQGIPVSILKVRETTSIRELLGELQRRNVI